MADFKCELFRGRKPLFADQLLEDNAASVAKDCYMQAGNLQAFRDNVSAGANVPTLLTAIRSAYKYNGQWQLFDVDADVANSFNPNDVFNRRVYTTDDDNPPRVLANLTSTTGVYVMDEALINEGDAAYDSIEDYIKSVDSGGLGIAEIHDFAISNNGEHAVFLIRSQSLEVFIVYAERGVGGGWNPISGKAGVVNNSSIGLTNTALIINNSGDKVVLIYPTTDFFEAYDWDGSSWNLVTSTIPSTQYKFYYATSSNTKFLDDGMTIIGTSTDTNTTERVFTRFVRSGNTFIYNANMTSTVLQGNWNSGDYTFNLDRSGGQYHVNSLLVNAAEDVVHVGYNLKGATFLTAPYTDLLGGIRTFDISGTIWTLRANSAIDKNHSLYPTEYLASGDRYYGIGLAFNGDESRIIVGGKYSSSNDPYRIFQIRWDGSGWVDDTNIANTTLTDLMDTVSSPYPSITLQGGYNHFLQFLITSPRYDVCSIKVDIGEAAYAGTVYDRVGRGLLPLFPEGGSLTMGAGISISGDGGTMAIGAPAFEANSSLKALNTASLPANPMAELSGTVFLYKKVNDAWTYLDNLRFTTAIKTTSSYNVGYSTALNKDGSRLFVGQISSSYAGTPADIFQFDWNGSRYTKTTAFSTDGALASADEANRYIAWRMDTDDIGDALIVGAHSKNSNTSDGEVYIFDRVNGVWGLTVSVLADFPPSGFNSTGTSGGAFGANVAISPDGKYVAVSDYGHDTPSATGGGNVWIYGRFSSILYEEVNVHDDMKPAGYTTNYSLGVAVAITDKKLLIGTGYVSAPKVLEYRKSGDAWYHHSVFEEDPDTSRSTRTIRVTNDNEVVVVGYSGYSYPDVSETNQVKLIKAQADTENDDTLLGLPAPPKPTISKTGVASGAVRTTFYVMTFVNDFGEEGPPSDPSDELEITVGESATFTTPPAPIGNYRAITCRVYRTATGTSDADFLFVGEYPLNTAITDSIPDAGLSKPLATEGFDAPNPKMKGVVAMPGEFLAGFYDNVVALSKPGYYYAWPADYLFKTEYPIVGIKPVEGNTLLITTTSYPYLLSGNSPEAMTLQRYEDLESCTSKRGMLEIPGAVIYPSPNGLIEVTMGGVRNLTEGIFSVEQWRAFPLDKIRAVRWRDLYLCFFEDAGQTTGLVINPRVPELGVADIDNQPDGAFVTDPADDTTFWLNLNGNEAEVYEFGSATGAYKNTALWTSKLVEFVKRFEPRAIRILAATAAFPVTIDIDIDGTTKTISVADDRPQYIPVTDKTDTLSGRAMKVSVRNFTESVRLVHIAESLPELMERSER